MKILFIGNIANNSYLLASMLRKKGVEADVLAYDYYDIMGSPEWENASISGDWVSNEYPHWYNVDTSGFKRPDWFVQGPLGTCIEYLNTKDPTLKRELDRACQIEIPSAKERFFRYWRPSEWKFAFRENPAAVSLLFPFFCLKTACRLLRRKSGYPDITAGLKIPVNFRFKPELNALLAENPADWRSLFSKYDIVQAHSTDPIYPYVFGKHPFVALEHGTLRHIPFQDEFIGEMTRLSYREADKVLITNADNFSTAEKLGIASAEFIPHPVNETMPQGLDKDDLREKILSGTGSDYLVFHPARQHWDPAVRHRDWEKGNDIFIRGFAKFAKEIDPRASAIFVEWGRKVKQSKSLLESLGVAEKVKWIRPLPHLEFVRYVKACDIVADQFFLGSFGAITPKAMMCGKAVMLNLEEPAHAKVFPELPPVINSKSDLDVFEGLSKHYKDQKYRADIEKRSREWYWKYHSSDVIAERLANIYRALLQK